MKHPIKDYQEQPKQGCGEMGHPSDMTEEDCNLCNPPRTTGMPFPIDYVHVDSSSLANCKDDEGGTPDQGGPETTEEARKRREYGERMDRLSEIFGVD